MNHKNPLIGYGALFLAVAILPWLGVYPIFVMKVMCYALFACAFNLLIGFTGLLSFGHAAFLGAAAYGAGARGRGRPTRRRRQDRGLVDAGPAGFAA